MDKWFENKFEKNELREYTRKQLKPNYFESVARKFSVTNWLILINTLVFILVMVLLPFFGEEKMMGLLALQANAFFSGSLWTVFTSMFMHGNFAHLLFNMISLFFIGNFVERIIGRKKFFWFYLISGILAGFFYVLLSYFFGISELGARIFVSPDTFAVGASGAIFALLGLLAVLTPKNRVYLIMGPLIAIIFQALIGQLFPSSRFLPLLDLLITVYFVVSVFAIFSFSSSFRKLALPLEMPFWVLPIIAIVPLVIIGLFVDLPIGNTAHLGGLLVGLVYASYLKEKYPNKTRHLSVMFSK
ncbi:rhomboid family intramembrane serine protease [archaeon]|jgi:membrane associated rhomboid family serine protease|nr:rhomboid family intramembrane serine protease [archaeon]